MLNEIKDYMTWKLKSVLKIRNKGISGLLLQNLFPVPVLLHNIFRDLDVKGTQSPYQIRLIFKYLTYKFADTSKKSLEVYLIFIKLFQGNHLSHSSQQIMFTLSVFLHFAHFQDSSRSKTAKQEKVLCSMVCIFRITL